MRVKVDNYNRALKKSLLLVLVHFKLHFKALISILFILGGGSQLN